MNKMKQETLEEVAFNAGEKEFKEFRKGILEANRFDFVCGFTAGAKWQQEISYSEEDMKSAYEQGARLALLSQSPLALHKGEFQNPEEWFNDFKKENKLWK